MELRNKRKGVPAQQQESRPSKDSSGNTSKRVRSKAQNQPERASRRLRSRNGDAGPSSIHEGTPTEKPVAATAGNQSDSQDIQISQRVKQEAPAESDRIEEPGRPLVMAGSSGPAEQVRHELKLFMSSSTVNLHFKLMAGLCWFLRFSQCAFNQTRLSAHAFRGVDCRCWKPLVLYMQCPMLKQKQRDDRCWAQAPHRCTLDCWISSSCANVFPSTQALLSVLI